MNPEPRRLSFSYERSELEKLALCERQRACSARRSSRSPKLAAFVARNGPLDHFVRLGRSAPHPSAWAMTRLPLCGRSPPKGGGGFDGRASVASEGKIEAGGGSLT